MIACDQIEFVHSDITNLSAWVAVVMTQALVNTYAGGAFFSRVEEEKWRSIISPSKQSLCQVVEQLLYFGVCLWTVVLHAALLLTAWVLLCALDWHPSRFGIIVCHEAGDTEDTLKSNLSSQRCICRNAMNSHIKPPPFVVWTRFAKIVFPVFSCWLSKINLICQKTDLGGPSQQGLRCKMDTRFLWTNNILDLIPAILRI